MATLLTRTFGYLEARSLGQAGPWGPGQGWWNRPACNCDELAVLDLSSPCPELNGKALTESEISTLTVTEEKTLAGGQWGGVPKCPEFWFSLSFLRSFLPPQTQPFCSDQAVSVLGRRPRLVLCLILGLRGPKITPTQTEVQLA